jgi:hypothetical protein
VRLLHGGFRIALVCGLASLAGVGALGCRGERDVSGPGDPAVRAQAIDPDRPDSCPAFRPASERMPGVEDHHLELDYWLARFDDEALDEVLLSPEEIQALSASMAVPREGFYGQAKLLEPLSEQDVADRIEGRWRWMAEKLDAGEYVFDDGGGPLPELPARLPPLDASVRVALGEVPFYCAPTTDPMYSEGSVLALDRNRCSTAHAQEPLEVLARWSDAFLLARTRYSWGWIPADAPLSPPLAREMAERFVRGPHVVLGASPWSPGLPGVAEIPAGARLPLDRGGQHVHVAGDRGVAAAPPPAGARPVTRPLTRRAVLEEAFSLLGSPYGFGGAGGGRDCSRYLLDIFERFGIAMPRHSGWQARAGSFSIDVSGLDEQVKLGVVDAAAAKGVVLLQFPGHIMLYLGRDDTSRPMAIHALAEYLEPCDGEGDETTVAVDRIQVSDLELGRGSSRTSFIERVSRVAVLGHPPGFELGGVAEVRPAAPVAAPAPGTCAGSDRLLVTPALPGADAPLRVVAATSADPGAAELALFGPDGYQAPAPLRLGGPPYGWVVEVEEPKPGSWTAVLGDGDRVLACERFKVGRRVGTRTLGASDGPGTEPIWPVEHEWNPAFEDLFSIFVERLFDYPVDEDLTWPNLNEVVRDRDRNLLFGYLGRDEEEALNFVPDCAELPYTLRAYFAWKMGLPFGYHGCSRARDNRPPRCREGGTNLMSRATVERSGDVEAFQQFVHRRMRSIVHSSAGRTVPDYEASDYYPVPLTREALRPGVTFVDPYGHLLVIVKWVPQTFDRYGILIGADAQPDHTVGRRRFWRGSFLFMPETHSGGAGFKAFRPWRTDGTRLTQPSNEALRNRPQMPYSTEQYEGTIDDFYDRMNAIINPRPLDPQSVMLSLVDALEESVSRRINSVDNGERFMRSRSFRHIDMPTGSSIFLTTGPWEDFSTPSRDWRLLVSMDTVIEFPEAVARSPAQYGVAPDAADAEVEAIRQVLREALKSRRFSYERSDGSEWELSLADLVDRLDAFELAWNPNDCPEVRWAAPEGSEELATCNRRAPEAQRARMAEYRPWFSERSRPAR